MNKIALSEIDRTIMSICGKKENKRYASIGTESKKLFCKWLDNSDISYTNLKNSLILINNYLCSVTCARANSFTVGKAAAEVYENEKYKASWRAIFVFIKKNTNEIEKVYVSNDKPSDLLNFYDHTTRSGGYYSCAKNKINNCIEKGELIEFKNWMAEMDKRNV